MSSLSVGKDSITLEEVKSNLYSRELRLKVSRNGDEASTSGLLVNDFARGQKNKKGKGGKKSRVYPKDICNYCKEPGHWKRDCPKKDFVVALVQNESSSEIDLVMVVCEQLQQHFEQ